MASKGEAACRWSDESYSILRTPDEGVIGGSEPTNAVMHDQVTFTLTFICSSLLLLCRYTMSLLRWLSMIPHLPSTLLRTSLFEWTLHEMHRDDKRTEERSQGGDCELLYIA